MAKAGHNSIDPATAKRFLQEVRRTYEDEETERASFRGKCSAIKERRKQVYERAESSGIPAKLLKARITQWIEDKRIAEAKARREAAVPDDIDDRARFEQLCEALGEFKDTPLGEAAMNAAKSNADDGEEDIRPAHLRRREKDRNAEAAKENVVKLEKGIKPLRGLPGAEASEA
jgi:hypothetical protein